MKMLRLVFLLVAILLASPVVAATSKLNFGDAVLIESNRAEVNFNSTLFEADVTVVSFVFLNCGVTCPGSLLQMSRLDASTAFHDKTVALITITIDPENDTSELLAKKRFELDASKKWRWFGGTSASIRDVLTVFRLKKANMSHHDSDFFLVGKAGQSLKKIKSVRKNGKLTTAEDLVQEVQKFAN